MIKKVLVLDCLLLEYVKRRRGNSGQCLETRREIGFAGEDEVQFDDSKCRIYRSLQWAGELWTRIEHVLVGDGQWHIPKPAHPDCLVVREPYDGEIFDSDRELLWLAPSRCEVLSGTLAARLFESRHGDVIGDLAAYLKQQVFEECLGTLTAEYGHEIEGDVGRYIVTELTRAVDAAKLIGADEEVVQKIAASVHQSILRFMDQAAE